MKKTNRTHKTHMRMTKRLLGFGLALAMLLTMLPGTVAQAATKSITLYVGEKVSYYGLGTVSKVSSSNKKVVAAAKDKENTYLTNMTAKAAGKATVTVKGSSGTGKFQVTVKKLSFSVKLKNLAGSYATIAIKNNTAQTFEKIAVSYTFKDADGEVVKQDTETVSRVPAKKTVYASIYVGSSQAEMIDLASSSAKVTEVQHDPDYTYKDVSSKVTATVKDETENDSNVTFSVTSKNSTNQAVYGYNYILIYDADDTLLGVTSLSIYLDKKATNTSTSGYISKYTYPAYDHFEIVTQAYYKARNK